MNRNNTDSPVHFLFAEANDILLFSPDEKGWRAFYTLERDKSNVPE